MDGKANKMAIKPPYPIATSWPTTTLNNIWQLIGSTEMSDEPDLGPINKMTVAK